MSRIEWIGTVLFVAICLVILVAYIASDNFSFWGLLLFLIQALTIGLALKLWDQRILGVGFGLCLILLGLLMKMGLYSTDFFSQVQNDIDFDVAAFFGIGGLILFVISGLQLMVYIQHQENPWSDEF